MGGGSSNDNNDFSNSFISLIGVAVMILSFTSIAEQKSDK